PGRGRNDFVKARLAVLFLMILLLPLAVMGWLGWVVAHDQEQALRQSFQELLTAKLRDVDDDIARLLQERERELLKLTERPTIPPFPEESAAYTNDDAEAIRLLVLHNPRVRQIFVLRPDGKLLYPNVKNDPTAAEAEFVQRVWGMLTRKDLLYQA